MSVPTLLRLLPALLLLAAPVGAAAQTATIHRDAWGAPHVLSDTDQGAVLGGPAGGRGMAAATVLRRPLAEPAVPEPDRRARVAGRRDVAEEACRTGRNGFFPGSGTPAAPDAWMRRLRITEPREGG